MYPSQHFPWFQPWNIIQKRVFLALNAYILWLLAKKGKNHVLHRLKIDPYLKNMLHQGCENALKALLWRFCVNISNIVAPKMVSIRCWRENWRFRLKYGQRWSYLDPFMVSSATRENFDPFKLGLKSLKQCLRSFRVQN